MTLHDYALVERVAEAIRLRSPLNMRQARALAPAVLDALDLPGRERRAKAEALREAADEWRAEPYVTLTFSGSLVAVNLNARAAEIDPEEGGHE